VSNAILESPDRYPTPTHSTPTPRRNSHRPLTLGSRRCTRSVNRPRFIVSFPCIIIFPFPLTSFPSLGTCVFDTHNISSVFYTTFSKKTVETRKSKKAFSLRKKRVCIKKSAYLQKAHTNQTDFSDKLTHDRVFCRSKNICLHRFLVLEKVFNIFKNNSLFFKKLML